MATPDGGVTGWLLTTVSVAGTPDAAWPFQPSRGSSTNTGICRVVFSWYSAYGG